MRAATVRFSPSLSVDVMTPPSMRSCACLLMSRQAATTRAASSTPESLVILNDRHFRNVGGSANWLLREAISSVTGQTYRIVACGRGRQSQRARQPQSVTG